MLHFLSSSDHHCQSESDQEEEAQRATTSHTRQGENKRAMSQGNGKFTIVIFICSFFEIPPFKNWPSRSTNLIFNLSSCTNYQFLVLVCTFTLTFSFLYHIHKCFLAVNFTQFKWARSYTLHILACSMSATSLHSFMLLKFSFCFRLVYKQTMFPHTVTMFLHTWFSKKDCSK